MTTIMFLGGEETGDVAFCDWGRYRFTINQPVKCNDRHIINKASANRFFKVEEDDQPPPDRMAKARAAKATKLTAPGTSVKAFGKWKVGDAALPADDKADA